MFCHELVFIVLKFYFFLFERIINLLMLLSQRDQLLFSFPDALIVEVQGQRFALFLEFQFATKEHHTVFECCKNTRRVLSCDCTVE